MSTKYVYTISYRSNTYAFASVELDEEMEAQELVMKINSGEIKPPYIDEGEYASDGEYWEAYGADLEDKYEYEEEIDG